MPFLTAIDVVGIQRFVFASNRLKDVVSGSWLVHWSTAIDEVLKDLVDKDRVLLAAGGNVIVEFDTLNEARSFACRYTRDLHDKAPGLDVALIHRGYEKGKLSDALLKIQADLARLKMEPKVSSPLLGLSVTAACRETGLPAVGFDTSTEPTVELLDPLGKEILKRREAVDKATQLWKKYLQAEHFRFPMELDQLGRTIGDSSFIGIVHVDGNGVGVRIKKWLEKKRNEDADDDMVRDEYREWSSGMDQLADRVFRSIVRRVTGAITKNEKGDCEVRGKPECLSFSLKIKGNGCYLPLRPVLVAGDDITFISDGRIALDLAETALSAFVKSNVPHLGKITACAGIAIVPVHHPFYRAYELAERLCANAKADLRFKMQSEQGRFNEDCAMDWHIGVVPLGQPVGDFRKELYEKQPFSFTCRPYLLGSVESPETWMWLSRKLLDDPKTGLRGQVWTGHRNKAKKLGELIWEGPEQIKNAMKRWRAVSPKLRLPDDIKNDGFIAGKRTPLLDAMELMDLYLALDGNDYWKNSQGEKEASP